MIGSGAIRAWLRDYAACLAAAAPAIEAGEEPPDAFLPACQEFDTTLRQFDVGALRRELATPEGTRLMGALGEAKARFEAAITARQEQIGQQLHDVHRGRHALKGYADAGEHLRVGSLYVEKHI